jgi:hypothetical protein
MVADDYELVYRLFFIRCETHISLAFNTLVNVGL